MQGQLIIPLDHGQVAVIDIEDAEILDHYALWADKRGNTWYVRARPHGEDRKLYLHRILLSAPKGIKVDHRDRNGLNNSRSNIRLATSVQNVRNKGPQSNNKSGYKGVYWSKAAQKWQASIQHLGKTFYLGVFCFPEDAARAYDDEAKRLHGDFAFLNFDE